MTFVASACFVMPARNCILLTYTRRRGGQPMCKWWLQSYTKNCLCDQNATLVMHQIIPSIKKMFFFDEMLDIHYISFFNAFL